MPQLAALQAGMIILGVFQQFFHIGRIVQATLLCRLRQQYLFHKLEELTAHIFQCRHGEIGLAAVDHLVRQKTA